MVTTDDVSIGSKWKCISWSTGSWATGGRAFNNRPGIAIVTRVSKKGNVTYNFYSDDGFYDGCNCRQGLSSFLREFVNTENKRITKLKSCISKLKGRIHG